MRLFILSGRPKKRKLLVYVFGSRRVTTIANLHVASTTAVAEHRNLGDVGWPSVVATPTPAVDLGRHRRYLDAWMQADGPITELELAHR